MPTLVTDYTPKQLKRKHAMREGDKHRTRFLKKYQRRLERGCDPLTGRKLTDGELASCDMYRGADGKIYFLS